jgi:predicted TIM-barrel fold metal-dependent hydrolase
MIRGYPVTDLHVHIQPWEMLLPEVQSRMKQGRRDLDEILSYVGSPSRFLKFLDRTGVERAALINYVSPDLMGFTDDTNAWCARYCREAPDRLIPFGSVHPRFSEDPAGDARRILDLGIRGLKVHPPHQVFQVNDYRTGGPGKGIGEVFEVAENRGVPVMIHTGTSVFPGARNVYADPMPVDDVAVDFPGLKLIVAHAGRPLWGDESFFLARRHPNVYLEISSIPPKGLLEYLPRLSEVADRVLWGTDWPGPGVPDVHGNVEQFLDLGLPEDLCRKILHDNSMRLFP